jgi:Cdc6-like AAA superfamily ATPase
VTEPVVRLKPVVSWPRQVSPGQRYLVTVDVELDDPASSWPYDQEEYAIGCMIDGSPGFDIESVGDTTLVVHRFGGTYGPAKFVAHALDDSTGDWNLSLTLVTAGGVPFRTLTLPVQGTPVDRQIVAEQVPEPVVLLPRPSARSLFYGREKELALAREFLTSRDRHILIFTGLPGSGKTALLQEIAQRLHRQVCRAVFDCRDTTTKTPREIICALIFELSRESQPSGRPGFPRLLIGLRAIDRELTKADRQQARAQVEEYGSLRNLKTSVVALAAFALPGIGLPAGMIIADLIVKGLGRIPPTRTAALRRGMEWWGHRDTGFSDDPLDVLIDLNRMAVASPRNADALLWNALLADLRDARRSNPLAKRLPTYAILIDNIDTPSGREVLDTLITAHDRDTEHKGAPHALLTVIATARVDPLLSSQKSRRYVSTQLDDLSERDCFSMMAALPRHIAGAVHRFTNGHAGSIRMITEALMHQPETASSMRAVLDLQVQQDNDRPIRLEVLLLKQFVHDLSAMAVHDYTTYVAARHLREATALTEVPTPLPAALGVPLGRRSKEIVVHPLLRRLLLNRLAQRPDHDPDNWTSVFERLRERCIEHEDLTGELYHSLALGELETVTQRLAEQFQRVDIASWLGLLDAVTAAPNRLHLNEYRDFMAVWSGPRNGVMRTLANLVPALWLVQDPLISVEKGLHSQIADAYRTLAMITDFTGTTPLLKRVERHRRAEEG